DLGTRAQPSDPLPYRPPDDVRLCQRCVVTAIAAELALKPARRTEHATLALDHVEQLGWSIGHILAEHADALVDRHDVVQRAIDRVAESDGFAVGLGRCLF